jgi:RND family efflux transporter MFP subunit
MRMSRAAVAAVIAVLALAASACGGKPPAQGQSQGMPPTPVALAATHALPIEDASEYVATIKSLHSTTIQPQIDGRITQILVKSGDRVAAGAPLVQIDAHSQEAAVLSQESARTAKAAAVAFARQQAERASRLYEAGAISKQELEQAQTARETADADLAALQAQVQQQQAQLRYYSVTAPTAGVIGDVPVRVGMQVSTGTLLTTMDQNDTLEVQVSVPIERAADVKVGLPIRILASDGARTLAMTSINFVASHVDEQTQSILVKGAVPNQGGALRASQFVRARIVWKSSDGIVVPVTAVTRVNGQFFVFVADAAAGGLVAHQRPVTLGPIVDNDYPVLAGLTLGERVVVSGSQKLVDGAPIVEAAAAPPAPGQK